MISAKAQDEYISIKHECAQEYDLAAIVVRESCTANHTTTRRERIWRVVVKSPPRVSPKATCIMSKTIML